MIHNMAAALHKDHEGSLHAELAPIVAQLVRERPLIYPAASAELTLARGTRARRTRARD